MGRLEVFKEMNEAANSLGDRIRHASDLFEGYALGSGRGDNLVYLANALDHGKWEFSGIPVFMIYGTAGKCNEDSSPRYNHFASTVFPDTRYTSHELKKALDENPGDYDTTLGGIFVHKDAVNPILQKVVGSADAFEDRIKKYDGIDMLLLELGSDGYIKGVEAAADPSSGFHIHRKGDCYELRAGMGNIMKARQIAVVALGKQKSNGVYHFVNGNYKPDHSPNVLRTHPSLSLILDEEAASHLPRKTGSFG